MSLSDLAAIATAFGVLLVAAELVLARRQQRTAFEDQMSREYREIARCLPLEVFFSSEGEFVGPADEVHPHLDGLFRYIDLCNEQVFLRKNRRISSSTWTNWAEGMEQNFRRPAFSAAWNSLRSKDADTFGELERLYGNWDDDPALWNLPRWRLPVEWVRQLSDRPNQ
jgi:hypothetical protein